MALLADLLSVRFVARHARFDVILGLESMCAPIDSIDKAWNVGPRQHHVVSVTIRTELSVAVTRLAIPFEGLRIQGVRERIVQRMAESVEVVTFVTVLTEVHVVASLAGLVSVHRCVRSRDIRVRAYEVGSVTQRNQWLAGRMAKIALDGSHSVLIMAVEALHHAREHFGRSQFDLRHTRVAALACNVCIDVSLVREHPAVRFDTGHLLRVIWIAVTRGALIVIVHVVAVGTDGHFRKQVVQPCLAFCRTAVTIGALELLIFDMQLMRENEFGLAPVCRQSRNGIIPDKPEGTHHNEHHQREPGRSVSRN